MSMFSKGVPYVENIKSGDTVAICQCGATKTAPFCDGSHSAHPDKSPHMFTAESEITQYICGCGKTNNGPWCDGSHLG